MLHTQLEDFDGTPPMYQVECPAWLCNSLWTASAPEELQPGEGCMDSHGTSQDAIMG